MATLTKTRKELTQKTLEALTAADHGLRYALPSGLSGQVRAKQDGAVSVDFQYRYRGEDGKPRMKRIGSWPKVSLKAIYDEADLLAARVKIGLDPIAEERRERDAVEAARQEAEKARLQAEAEALAIQRQQEAERKAAEREAAAPTIQDLFEQWDLNHGKTLEAHWRVVRRSHWRCHVQPFIGKCKIPDASKPALMKHFDALIRDGKDVTARRVLALVKQVMQWGVERGLVAESHPLATMNLPKKSRTVKTEQLAENFDAAKYIAKHGAEIIGEDSEDGKAGRALQFAELVELLGDKLTGSTQAITGKSIIQFMLATGVRASQAVRLRWKWVLLEQRVIIFPAGSMKAKKMHHVHLSDYTIGVLKQMEAIRMNEFVFPAPIKAGAAVRRDNVGNDIATRQFYRADDESEADYQARLAERMKCRRTRADFERYNLSGGKWTLYDLRRTTATRLCELTGSDWDTIQRVLAHADPHGVTGKYVRFSKWEDRCNALNMLGVALADCAAGALLAHTAENIVQLRRA